MGECFTRLAERLRQAPAADDMMSVIVAAQGDDKLTGRELVTMAALLLVAGFETSSGLLSKGLVALPGTPSRRPACAPSRTSRRLGGREELICWRLRPLQLVPNRTAEEDIEVAGVKLSPPGSRSSS